METTSEPKNDPRLTKLVQVRVTRAFYVAGRPLWIGDEAMIEFAIARDLRDMGKCVLLEEQEP
ncbi:MAG: hypothetical protein L0H94_06850 [Nitrospira sp.]|nr:hypothetical protein [Nitrosospira sp.]MDN5941582.1 hypothetical protein [Nitrospira sp.]